MTRTPHTPPSHLLCGTRITSWRRQSEAGTGLRSLACILGTSSPQTRDPPPVMPSRWDHLPQPQRHLRVRCSERTRAPRGRVCPHPRRKASPPLAWDGERGPPHRLPGARLPPHPAYASTGDASTVGPPTLPVDAEGRLTTTPRGTDITPPRGGPPKKRHRLRTPTPTGATFPFDAPRARGPWRAHPWQPPGLPPGWDRRPSVRPSALTLAAREE